MNLIKTYKKNRTKYRISNKLKMNLESLKEEPDKMVTAVNCSCLIVTIDNIDVMPGDSIRVKNSIVNTVNTMHERPIFIIEDY